MTQPTHYDRADHGACVRYEMSSADDKEQPMSMDPNAAAAPDSGGVTLSAETLQALAGMIASGCKQAIAEFMEEGEQQPSMEPGMEGGDVPPELLGEATEGEPGMEAPPSEEPPMPEDEKERYERHDLAVKYSRLEAQLEEQKALNAKTQAQLAEFAKRETVARYEKEISDLQAAGYAIDKAKEMPRLMKFKTDEDRNEYMAGLKENGKRVPRAGFSMDYSRREDPVQYSTNSNQPADSGQLTPEQAHAARDYALRNNTNFAAGKAHVLANGKA